MHRTDIQFERKSIYALIIVLSPSIKQGEINPQQDLGRFAVPTFPFITEVRHIPWVPPMVREREEAADGNEKCKKPAMSTKLSGSDLHSYFGEGFDYSSPYRADKLIHWQSI